MTRWGRRGAMSFVAYDDLDEATKGEVNDYFLFRDDIAVAIPHGSIKFVAMRGKRVVGIFAFKMVPVLDAVIDTDDIDIPQLFEFGRTRMEGVLQAISNSEYIITIPEPLMKTGYGKRVAQENKDRTTYTAYRIDL